MLTLSCFSIYCLLIINFEKDYWMIKAWSVTVMRVHSFNIEDTELSNKGNQVMRVSRWCAFLKTFLIKGRSGNWLKRKKNF